MSATRNKKYTVQTRPSQRPQIVDNLGNVIARVTWKNMARRIARLLNQENA
jgi:hypothetical protein